MVLPVIALCLPQIAAIARLTRGSMIEVLRTNFVRTARAKGLPEQPHHHAPRAAAPRCCRSCPISGPAIAGIITGSVVIEQIFRIPGIGRYFVQGALNRDYTLVMGVSDLLRRADHRAATWSSTCSTACSTPRSGTIEVSHGSHADTHGRRRRQEVKGRSLWADARRRFLRNKAAVASLVVFMHHRRLPRFVGALSRPAGARTKIDWDLSSWSAAEPREPGYCFGTDGNGRDLFVRTLYGGQVSLTGRHRRDASSAW